MPAPPSERSELRKRNKVQDHGLIGMEIHLDQTVSDLDDVVVGEFQSVRDPVAVQIGPVQTVVVPKKQPIAFFVQDRMLSGDSVRSQDDAVRFVTSQIDLPVGEFNRKIFLFQAMTNNPHPLPYVRGVF